MRAVRALPLAGQHAPARQRAAHRGRDGRRRAADHEQHLSDDFLEDVQRLPGAARRRRGACRAPAEPRGARRAAAVCAGGPQPRRAASRAGRPRICARSARTLGEAELEMIRDALAAADGNISVASKRLGISRNTIYRKLRWQAAEPLGQRCPVIAARRCPVSRVFLGPGAAPAGAAIGFRPNIALQPHSSVALSQEERAVRAVLRGAVLRQAFLGQLVAPCR